jgi:glycosyltransferase involved in cell wall biosynthesis
MKAAIVCGAGIVSGKEVMALELGEGLREEGCSVFFVTSLWGNGDFAARLRSHDFPFARMRIGFISATLTIDNLRMTADQMMHWPKLLYDYNQFILRERPDYVIHTNWHHMLVLLPFLKEERDIFWLHETVPNKPQYVRLFSTLSRRIRCFVAVSNAVARALGSIGIADTKVYVIHSGIRDPVRGAPIEVECRERLQIGIVGQVGSWKGHEDLLKAFALISRNYPNAELCIFGVKAGEFAAHLERLAEELGVSAQLVWKGYVSEKSAIYSALAVCVIPSRSDDPLPTVAIEAAFFGLPVIATRKGGLAEIITEGSTGYLVDAENPTQLAARLDELLQSQELRRSMGGAARKRALHEFSQRRFVDDFLRLLHPAGNLSF